MVQSFPFPLWPIIFLCECICNECSAGDFFYSVPICGQGLSLANIPSLLKLLTFSHRPAKFASMMKMLLKLILNILLRTQKDSDLVLENLALRQQLAILKRPKKRPQIRTKDRLFWIMLCRFWSNWQEPLWTREGHSRWAPGSAQTGQRRQGDWIAPGRWAASPLRMERSSIGKSFSDHYPISWQWPVFSSFLVSILTWLIPRFIDNKVFLKASDKQKSQPALRQVN